MCIDCYRSHRPVELTPEIEAVATLIKEWLDLPLNIAGGALHIVLDDFNIEDEDIVYCLDARHEMWLGHRWTEDHQRLFQPLCVALLSLGIDERAAAVALATGLELMPFVLEEPPLSPAYDKLDHNGDVVEIRINLINEAIADMIDDASDEFIEDAEADENKEG